MNKYTKFDAVVVCELHPLFKGLMWVAAARSTDESRYAITLINVERTGLEWKMVATDGRRMHVSTFDAGLFSDDLEMIETGLWEVITKTNKLIVVAPASMSATYPNWRAIMPGPRPFYRETVTADTISMLAIRTGVLMRSAFVLDAIGFGSVLKKTESAQIEYSSNGADEPFMIRHEVGEAIISPLRANEEEEHEAEEKEEDSGTDDLPGFAAGMEALTSAMSDGDSMTISVGSKKVTGIRKKQGTIKPIDEEI